MVTTRSSVANEPLERLVTPPKRPRKAQKAKAFPPQPQVQPQVQRQARVQAQTRTHSQSKTPAQVQVQVQVQVQAHSPSHVESKVQAKLPTASPDVVTAQDVDVDVNVGKPLYCRRSAFALDVKSLTAKPAQTESPTASAKRSRDDAEPYENGSPSKRARTQPTTPASDDLLFMFPKKDAVEDADVSLSAPPKTLVDTFRRNRLLREQQKKNTRFNSLPRRQPAKLNGDNPFGMETFTQQELAEQAAQHAPRNPSPEKDGHHRDARSAAPEPETPRRGLFGSLRNIGSATINRVFSPFGRPGIDSPGAAAAAAAATAPQIRTEPRRKPIRAWEIQYPDIDHEPESEEEKKRHTFEASFGKPDALYDHLHTIPVEGTPQNLPYPPKTQALSVSVLEDRPPLSDALQEMRQRRKERRERLHGKTPVHEPPKMAPLFGPNSHYARGTKNPTLEDFFGPGPHPAMRQGVKRSLDDALTEDPTSRQSIFQPYCEDESELPDASFLDDPTTPPAKRQKMLDKTMLQTPRSALKVPGSIGRSGRSARFNDDPVASIKRMSPIAGSTPAGEYPYHPNNIFGTFDDDRRHKHAMGENDDSPTSNVTFTPSPTTKTNTLFNTGRRHPGDALTQAMNDAAPDDREKRVHEYVWRDPNDPEWRPSLANPRPGTFRFVPEDEMDIEEEALAEIEKEGASKSPEPTNAPEPPSTPRMSHAELPKSGTPATASTPSASALEAANLERRRAEASKNKPRTSSRLAEVTTAHSRSPSPPALDSDSTAADVSDSSAKTPSPVLDPANAPKWTWDASINEYTSSHGSYPDFAYNPHDELIPSFSMKTPSGGYDNTIVGPDRMTELQRQNYYKHKYNNTWAQGIFKFDLPQTYEEAGVGSKYIHDMIKKNEDKFPQIVHECDERFEHEWDTHLAAIVTAIGQGKNLVATYPDRDGIDMQEAEEL